MGTDSQILQGMQDEKRVIYWKQESGSKAGKIFCLHCVCVVNSIWDVVDGCRWQQMATDSKVSELFIRWKTKSASRYMLNAKDSACMLFAHNAYNSDNTPIKVRKTAWRNI